MPRRRPEPEPFERELEFGEGLPVPLEEEPTTPTEERFGSLEFGEKPAERTRKEKPATFPERVRETMRSIELVLLFIEQEALDLGRFVEEEENDEKAGAMREKMETILRAVKQLEDIAELIETGLKEEVRPIEVSVPEGETFEAVFARMQKNIELQKERLIELAHSIAASQPVPEGDDEWEEETYRELFVEKVYRELMTEDAVRAALLQNLFAQERKYLAFKLMKERPDLAGKIDWQQIPSVLAILQNLQSEILQEPDVNTSVRRILIKTLLRDGITEPLMQFLQHETDPELRRLLLEEKLKATLSQEEYVDLLTHEKDLDNSRLIINAAIDAGHLANLVQRTVRERSLSVPWALEEDLIQKAVKAGMMSKVEQRELTEVKRVVVKDAVNPYREALLEGGITDSDLTAEKKDVVLDMNQLAEQSVKYYRSQNLPEWADALEAERRTFRLTPEKRAQIEAEFKKGSIPILMPGRDVQLATYKKALENLKPLWIKDSEEQTLEPTYRWDYYDELINRKAKELVADVPDRPYVLLSKPTQAPPQESCDKTVDEQKAYLAELQKEAKKTKQPTPYAMLPAEYAATESVFTRRVKEEAGKKQLTALSPLDSITWTRFIDLPLSPGGDVPFAGFDPDYRGLGFGSGSPEYRNSARGVRPVARVEI